MNNSPERDTEAKDAKPVDKARAARLRQARTDAGFPSARATAEHFGWPYATYATHENGTRNIGIEALERYALALQVSMIWLISGQGTRDAPRSRVRVEGWIEAELRVVQRTEKMPDGIPDDVEAPSGEFAEKMSAWYFRNDANAPIWYADDVIYTYKVHKPPVEYIGKTCVVQTADQGLLVRILRWHLGENRFLIVDFGHHGVQTELLDAAPVAWTRHSRNIDGRH